MRGGLLQRLADRIGGMMATIETRQDCAQRCGRVAVAYAVDPYPDGWGGAYCEACIPAGWLVVDKYLPPVDIGAVALMVREWAERNVPDQYRYMSPATWVGSALHAGVITRDQCDQIEKDYGDGWYYTGD